ncbi:hypothetical protein J7399_00890 [Shimia sp. R9_1]|uniref:hypothetical protein n=1 Tax=Shimia sp. R9_1 TaxID=2821111 RepID=UPI001ADCDB0E|nr:hypothetical protein [Shimia sp. R9_1]MBO9405967.1 hypothetical protein [Shimia sp. R9_1]
MDLFEAGVQYNDLKGTVAADRSDVERLRDFAAAIEPIEEGEVIVAQRLSIGENHGREVSTVGVVIYLASGPITSTELKQVRSIEFEMPISEFFKYFKRFDLVMVNKGLDLSSTEVLTS